jgi:hypothetical protein
VARAGLQSELEVETSPTIPGQSMMQAHTWSWIWFGVAVLTIVGFHIRMFGHAVPPAAHFP